MDAYAIGGIREMKLSKRESDALFEISRHTRTPTKERHGYSKYWTPKTNQHLQEKGLVEFVHDSVVITDAGISVLEEIGKHHPSLVGRISHQHGDKQES